MTNDNSAHRVLVVEDECLIALHLREALSDMGLKPHVFTEGKPALAAIDCTTYSAAVLDLGLPDISGDHIVSALLERDPKFRIVLTTGQDRHEVEQRYLGATRVRVLSKPFDAQMLEEELATLGVVQRPMPVNQIFARDFSEALMIA